MVQCVKRIKSHKHQSPAPTKAVKHGGTHLWPQCWGNGGAQTNSPIPGSHWTDSIASWWALGREEDMWPHPPTSIHRYMNKHMYALMHAHTLPPMHSQKNTRTRTHTHTPLTAFFKHELISRGKTSMFEYKWLPYIFQISVSRADCSPNSRSDWLLVNPT